MFLGFKILDFDLNDITGLWGGRVLNVHKSALMPQSGHKSWPPEIISLFDYKFTLQISIIIILIIYIFTLFKSYLLHMHMEE